MELSSANNGQPVRIKAVQSGKYILAEGTNGVAPENITIKRVGKDLHIALEDRRQRNSFLPCPTNTVFHH
ncbi:Large repetitive protein [Pseudomonas synxantha]|nr:Large repetitive protein [Pseudomonas synxantha]